MKLIRQRHEWGCVPAALAMLSGRTYDEMLKLIYPNRKKAYWNKDGVTDKAMYRAMNRLGLQYYKISPIPLSSLNYNALLIIHHPSYDIGEDHVVIWDYAKQRILDPLPGPNSDRKRNYHKKTYEKCLIEVLEIHQ